MKCPVCTNLDLLLSQRQGVEIDYCPNCRGVWLDRGELDKIIERDQGSSPRYQSEAPRSGPPPQYVQSHEQTYSPDRQGKYEDHRDRRSKHDEHHGHHEERRPEYGYEQSHDKHKKKSFLGDLFDFD